MRGKRKRKSKKKRKERKNLMKHVSEKGAGEGKRKSKKTKCYKKYIGDEGKLKTY